MLSGLTIKHEKRVVVVIANSNYSNVVTQTSVVKYDICPIYLPKRSSSYEKTRAGKRTPHIRWSKIITQSVVAMFLIIQTLELLKCQMRIWVSYRRTITVWGFWISQIINKICRPSDTFMDLSAPRPELWGDACVDYSFMYLCRHSFIYAVHITRPKTKIRWPKQK